MIYAPGVLLGGMYKSRSRLDVRAAMIHLKGPQTEWSMIPIVTYRPFGVIPLGEQTRVLKD